MASPQNAMTIHLNGKDREVPADVTILGLLESLELAPGMVVVEHNQEILQCEAYGAVRVAEGDRVELVHFVGGG